MKPTRRHPGGPIRTPAGYKAARYAAAKPNATREHKTSHRCPRRNVGRKHVHPYHKHPKEESSDGCDTNGNRRRHVQQPSVQQPSLQQPSIQRSNLNGKQKHAPHTNNLNPDKAQEDPSSNVRRRTDGLGQDEWDIQGEVHDHDFMVNLWEELRMQMWDIHTRYGCARKVLTRHTDLLALPDKQIRGALRHIWCDYMYTSMDTPRMAYKAISKANAKRMIETSQEHRRERKGSTTTWRM